MFPSTATFSIYLSIYISIYLSIYLSISRHWLTRSTRRRKRRSWLCSTPQKGSASPPPQVNSGQYFNKGSQGYIFYQNPDFFFLSQSLGGLFFSLPFAILFLGTSVDGQGGDTRDYKKSSNIGPFSDTFFCFWRRFTQVNKC